MVRGLGYAYFNPQDIGLFLTPVPGFSPEIGVRHLAQLLIRCHQRVVLLCAISDLRAAPFVTNSV